MRPVQEKFEEYLTEQEHGDIAAEFQIEHFEVIVQHDDGLGDGKRELAFHDDLYALVEGEIVEGCWHFFLFLAEHGQDLTDEDYGSDYSQRLMDVSFIEQYDDNGIKQFLIGQQFEQTSLQNIGILQYRPLLHLQQETFQYLTIPRKILPLYIFRIDNNTLYILNPTLYKLEKSYPPL